MSSRAGPIASRTASTRSMPRSKRRRPASVLGSLARTSSNGATLIARKPRSAASRARAAKPAGLRSCVPRLTLAYSATDAERGVPSAAASGTPCACAARSHTA
jgi:hypothetical protein